MNDELAHELHLATSDLLDLTRLRISPGAGEHSSSASHQPPVSIPLPVFSPESRLEPIYSPSDVRPFTFDFPRLQKKSNKPDADDSTDTQNSTASTSRIVQDDAADHLPTAGLSSKVGSVRGDQARQNIVITGAADGAANLDEIGVGSSNGTWQRRRNEDVPRPASGLRARLALDDVYLNEYGERVVNGKVMGRLRGGRKRHNESPADGAGPSHEGNGIASTSSQLASTSDTAQASGAVTFHGHDERTRTKTPPAFFLQSFPDALDPGRRTPVNGASVQQGIADGAKQGGAGSSGSPSSRLLLAASEVELKAPRPAARALNFGGEDDLDEELSEAGSDEDEMHSASSEADVSSASRGGAKSRAVAASARGASAVGQGPATSPPINIAPSAVLSPPPSAATRSRSSSVATSHIDRPTSRNSVASITRTPVTPGTSTRRGAGGGGAEKLEIPSISRRATPTIELSATQTEHLTLHGNKLQALRSDKSPRGGGDGEATTGEDATRPQTLGRKIESLFHTPLVPPAPAAVGASSSSSSAAARPRPNSTSSGRGSGSSDLRPGTLAEREPSNGIPIPNPRRSDAHTNPTSDDELETASLASLDSLPSSLLSLPVSTLTSSSHAASFSSLERRGSSNNGGRRRRSAGGGGGEEAGERFARDVRIRGWKEVGAQARGWVVFEVRIISKQGTTITIFRRFSSFVKLRQLLATEIKDQAKHLPPLPSRRTGLLHKYDAAYLETRRKALQSWLQIVLLDRVWGATEAAQRWVLQGGE